MRKFSVPHGIFRLSSAIRRTNLQKFTPVDVGFAPRKFSSENRPEVSSNQKDPPVVITDRCVEHLKKVAGRNGFLRVLVDSGGCSGFEYKFELIKGDQVDAKEDEIFEKDGATIVVDRLSLDFLHGATIDYQIELIKSAFRVLNNPKAAKGCSCGASFSLKT